MTPEQQQVWNEWLATRPASVRRIANSFPTGTRLKIHGQTMHVISYCEDGSVSVSATDPGVDYDKALADREPVCKCCIDKLELLRV